MLKWFGVSALALGAALGAPGNAKADTIDEITLTTVYSDAAPAGTFLFQPFGSPNPDTGFAVFTNAGNTTFTGILGDVAVSNFNGDNSFTTAVTLLAGQSLVLAINFEASNQGGYNGPFGTLQPGVGLIVNGTFSDGLGTSTNTTTNDSDIHSGVPRTNPFGVTLDSYVLQGGDPFGRDTGDGYEETQAPGSAVAFFQDNPNRGVPGPIAGAGLPGLIAACGGLFGWWRRRKKEGAAAFAAA